MLRRMPLVGCSVVCVVLALPAGFATQAPREPDGSYVQVNGKHLWYRVEGRGAPLVLVAGGPGASHTYFWPHMSRLAKDFTVVYFDAYGRGRSERAANRADYTFARDVDEVEALRQALKLGKMNLYGHSYGGMVAQAYALKYPGSLSHLVLADTLHSAEAWQKGNNDTWNMRLQDQMPELWERLQALRAKGHLSCDPEYLKAEGEMPVALSFFYDPSHAGRPEYGATELSLDVYCQLAGADADITLGGDLASLDFRPRLKEIGVPTLVLAGRFDRVSIPRFAIDFARLIPGATFVMFEKSGHYPFVEEPDAHDAAVRAFLKK